MLGRGEGAAIEQWQSNYEYQLKDPMEMRDPFNFPTAQRADRMSLSTINQMRDGQKTTTKKFVTNRMGSTNLYTLDIEGKIGFDQPGAQPKLFGSRVMNKPDVQNYNCDIDGSMPRQLHVGT